MNDNTVSDNMSSNENIVINVDGEIVPGAEARVPVLDRGFLYGDSVYEVFRTYQGVGFLVDEHFDRMQRSADFIGLRLGYSRALLLDQVRRTIDRGDFGGDVYVRIIVTRGAGPINLLPEVGAASRYVIIVKPVPQWPQRFYDEGVSLALPQVYRNSKVSLDPNIKGGNYLNNILGMMQACERGADDCMMLNHDEQVAESSTSNMWFVIDDTFHSPDPEHGNLRGLTREVLLEVLGQQGLRCNRGALPVDKLDRASECFMTGTTRDVMPVRSIALYEDAVLEFPPGGGADTRQAMALFERRVRQYVDDNRDHALCRRAA